jgi:hypothetical protein
MIANIKDTVYKTVPGGAYYHGMKIVDGDIHLLMIWNDLLPVEGTDREVKMTFRPFGVTIKGSVLLRDAKRHRIDVLSVSPRHQSMIGGEGLLVTDIWVKAAE